MTTRALLSAFALLRSWATSPVVVAVPCTPVLLSQGVRFAGHQPLPESLCSGQYPHEYICLEVHVDRGQLQGTAYGGKSGK